MIKIELNDTFLHTDAKQYLVQKQNEIDNLTTFSDKQDKAKKLWDQKSSVQKFSHVKPWLKSACVGIDICNYCENNEASDVEHIFPKKLYPERCFKSDNYLLACKQCNSGYKLDQFAVFSNATSSSIIEYKNKQVVSNAPPVQESVFIDPRTEDPMDYLLLNLKTGVFIPNIIFGSDPRRDAKASYTLQILQLNDRNGLQQYRSDAYSNFVGELRLCIQIKNVTTNQELEDIFFPGVIDTTKHVDQNISYAINQIKNRVLHSKNITVWYEMLRQYSLISTLRVLFDQLPEAKSWKR